MSVQNRLKEKTITASVPCRVDLGGTLDISTFYLAMMSHAPSTFNIALDLRTTVFLRPFDPGWVKVSSRGFEGAVFPAGRAPFHHPMGLMFAVAHYFGADGIHVHIESASPPRSALGGSSAAAVAMVAAFLDLLDRPVQPGQAAWLAHYLEAGVAGVPCGMQDQLAAAFGGANQWVWKMGKNGPGFRRNPVLQKDADVEMLDDCVLVAYCGVPHVSRDINGQWVQSFLRGETRSAFACVADLTRRFSRAVKQKRFSRAADLMNQETLLRLEMTPEVLDNTGKKLFEKATEHHCGARFTGAGGGGCVWAIGEPGAVKDLQDQWRKILAPVHGAEILETRVDKKGILLY